MKKTAIFVDVQNIYYTTRDAYQRQFNYRKFWQIIAEAYHIEIANAYAIARDDDQQHKFQTALKHIGFNVKLKPFIQRADGTAKGDWDVGITIDMMEAASQVEHIILLSGDGDFSLLLSHLAKKHQVSTHVFGVESLTSQTLIKSAHDYTPITEALLL